MHNHHFADIHGADEPDQLPTHLACVGEWHCGKQCMKLARQGNNYLVLESGSQSQVRYVVPIGSLREARFPMRWAVTKNCIAIGDPAPSVQDTLYNLELPARESHGLFVKKPMGEKSIEFTRPGARRQSRSRSRSRSRSGGRAASATSNPSVPMMGLPQSLPPGVKMENGDWFCPNCDAHNFKRNISCHECTTWKPGCEPASDDWLCPKCKYNNFRKAVTCRSCAAIRPGEELNANAALKESLVATIKRRQRESPVFKKAWYAYCDEASGGFYDPVKHEVGFLKHFLDNSFL